MGRFQALTCDGTLIFKATRRSGRLGAESDFASKRPVADLRISFGWAQPFRRAEEAAHVLDQMIRFRPHVSISFALERFPTTDPDSMDRLLDGLRKAGLPE